ncbi:patatin-like phospholipase family protein [Sutcliffiella sp. NC1]|uniref:patatin-like phospholipase family protein n=1 Tax=Sutcliffiella sp. NC1 TaxID=3004096 RepID=UPI0022DCF720|nr:patatin family protein [Sutcliffiella sp. NC1]WBL15973.1 patatin family protein [Sutcliffiella sp. NC1]
MENVGLVLEGGGMRGVYTAGVLEYFMKENLYFPYSIGVSAGACMAASYLSRQAGRNKKVNLDYVNDWRYFSVRNYFKKRQLFGMDFIFDEIPKRIVPFDFDAFQNSNEQLVIGTTDCHTGEAVYFNKSDHAENILSIIRASSSLPFVAPPVHYDNRILLDGGIIDPIPIRKAQQDGKRKNIVILTKPAGYFKKPSKFSSLFQYKEFPKVNGLLQTRHSVYNETIEYLLEEEKKENVIVLRPSVALPVGRMERNRSKLEMLYELGMRDAEEQIGRIREFIQ